MSNYNTKPPVLTILTEKFNLYTVYQLHFPESNRWHQASAGYVWIGPIYHPTAVLRGKRLGNYAVLRYLQRSHWRILHQTRAASVKENGDRLDQTNQNNARHRRTPHKIKCKVILLLVTFFAVPPLQRTSAPCDRHT